jgi:hypothetical protein
MKRTLDSLQALFGTTFSQGIDANTSSDDEYVMQQFAQSVSTHTAPQKHPAIRKHAPWSFVHAPPVLLKGGAIA